MYLGVGVSIFYLKKCYKNKFINIVKMEEEMRNLFLNGRHNTLQIYPSVIPPELQTNFDNSLINTPTNNQDDQTIFVPLQFLFTQSQIPSYKPMFDYAEIENDIDIDSIDNIEFDELSELFKKYSELSHKFIYNTTSRCDLDLGVYGFPRTTLYDDILNVINKKLNTFYPKYNEIIIFKDTEKVNGYQLYNCKTNLFTITDFFYFKKTIEEDKGMTFNEFEIEFEKITCSEWHKMDEHGESYGGFWQSDDDNIRDRAGDLSFENNCKKLYELPYSNKLKLWTIEYGCSTRQESVRYSNFICNWIQWKMYQMNEHIKQIDKKKLQK